MTYAEKLKDPRWQKKRLEILDRDNWSCVYCRDTESTLHVHHKKYNGNPWEAEDNDMITLCKYCHTIVEFYREHKNIKLKRFNCSGGKLFIITSEGNNKMFFEIVHHDETITELTSFDREIIYGLKKFFK